MRHPDLEKSQAPDPRDVETRLKDMQNAVCEAGGTISRRCYSDSEILDRLFRYHAPTEVQLPKYAAINQAAKNFAEIILQNCPHSADMSAAIRLIRDARMTANASIALDGLSL